MLTNTINPVFFKKSIGRREHAVRKKHKEREFLRPSLVYINQATAKGVGTSTTITHIAEVISLLDV